ncbi:MAG: SLBB domain-containing protein [Akkermansiaceae bacterium]|nr:SLBB domain-containing protein [Akkermansiaceae bacterium]
MKTTFLLGLLVALQAIGAAQAPRMTVRQDDGSVKELRIEEARIGVRFAGDVAETTLELNFRNSGPRAVEGEFALGLPPGATVSGYALEVNGAMRAGVAVEKERARTAYETVKRLLIDPGIVEREEGNVYRTRVYPVPADGTKRLRISYIETLSATNGELAYSLPLDFPDPLAVTCELRGGDLRVTDAAGLTFSPGHSGDLKAEAAGFQRKGTLQVASKAPKGDVMILEEGQRPEFMLTTRMPDMAPRRVASPATLRLVWDASASGRSRNHGKELELLGAWFARIRNTRVQFHWLRDTVEAAGEFEIRGGEWGKLRKALEEADYDGATDFSKIRVLSGDADLLVLVSDGTGTLGEDGPEIGVPLVFIHPAGKAAGGTLASTARISGGVAVAVSDVRAVEKVTMRPPRLVSVVGDGLEDDLVEPETGGVMRVFGVLDERRSGSLELRFGFGNEVTKTRTVRYEPGRNPEGLIRRLRAQRVLGGLESDGSRNREAIIQHCKEHGLVSDFTSLIVLERLEDYAEHGIRPPEPELQDAYEEAVASFQNRTTFAYDILSYSWRTKLAWYAKEFPGYEALILPRMRQVGIWKTAVERQFAPDQRDAEAFGTVVGWFEKAMELVKAKPRLRTAVEYADWCAGIDALHAQGPGLAATPLHPPPAGRPLAVSVRGLVVEPGLIEAAPPLTMREAIRKAGGVHAFGSLGHVALYRNAGKTVYNTLSDGFEDRPLFPADMIVVESPIPRWWEDSYSDDPFGVDPFADTGPGEEPESAGADPIREQADVWLPKRVDFSSMTLGTEEEPADESPRPAKDERIGVIPRLVVTADLPDLAAFAKDLAAASDPEAAYRKHRGGTLRLPEFYIDAARVLFEAKQDELGRRVLSNLLEFRPGDVTALRAYALWLAEFGQFEEAERVLETIGGSPRMKLLATLDLLSVRNQRGDKAAALSGWVVRLAELAELDSGPLASVALTEWNALRGMASDAAGVRREMRSLGVYETHLPVDLRVVLTSSDDSDGIRFEVEEPDGTKCSLSASPSPTGGRVTGADGVREYMIRHAVPGVYRIRCASEHPATVRAVIHTLWGRPEQTTKVATLWLENDRLRDVSEVIFEFEPAVE